MIFPRPIRLARRSHRLAARFVRTAWLALALYTGAAAQLATAPAAEPTTAEPTPELTPADRDFFEAKVRPILAERCYECHATGKTTEGDLRLDARDGWVKGGTRGPAIKPGDVDGSLLIKAVRHGDPELKMPPEKKLLPAELQTLAEWVRRGAPDPRTTTDKRAEPSAEQARTHWAFQPIVRTRPPIDVGAPQAVAILSPVDAWIARSLESVNLTPAPSADRRTLLRRLSFDLTGLPPSADDVEAFAADDAPDALSRQVDRLLASPRYGERWGRHWMDVARFADTKDGVLMYGDDRIRPYAYAYRDYVVRAFNDDLPFDRFITEQLAADLLDPPAAPERLAALGFLTLGRQFDNNVHDVLDDQIDVVSRGLLGLTAACARCHNHKFDPIPTSDYYGLYGVFASSEPPLVPPRLDPLARGSDAFEQAFAAKELELRTMLDQQYDLLTETARSRVADYLLHVATAPPDPLETAIFFLSLAPDDLRPPMIARWRQFVAQRSAAADPVFAPWNDLLAIDDARMATDSPAVLARWSERGGVNRLVLEALSSTPLQSRADVAKVYGRLLKEVYEQAKAARAAGGPAAPSADAAAALGADLPVEQKQLLDVVAGRDSPSYFPKRQTRQYMSRKEKDAFGGKLQELDKLAVQDRSAPPRAPSLIDSERPYEPRVFLRGNPSRLGTPVPRQPIGLTVGGRPRPFTQGSGRLELARSIVAPDNPLAARVLVNRVWMHHFGEPLVENPSDFGLRTPRPLLPELLDHLADTLHRQAWSLKALHRELLLTTVWRQSSVPSADALARDPENRRYSRMPRRRLELEAFRDTLLAVSGRADYAMYGRPVDAANDPAQRRRTVYGLVDRQSLPGFYRAFDFASPDQTVERRPNTTVPQQALFVLNSPQLIEQAKSLAALPEIAGEPDVDGRLQALVRRVLQREATAEELPVFREFLTVERSGAERSSLSPLEQLAQVLLLTNELTFVD